MNVSSSKRVSSYIEDIQLVSPWQHELVITIRDLFFEANEKLGEDIKYGGLVFSLSNDLVAGVFAYKKHITIEFSNGVNFSDSAKLLEGGGKKRRHLKIYSDEDVSKKNCAYYIAQAAELK